MTTTLKIVLAVILYLVVMFALVRRHLKIKRSMKRLAENEAELNRRIKE